MEHLFRISLTFRRHRSICPLFIIPLIGTMICIQANAYSRDEERLTPGTLRTRRKSILAFRALTGERGFAPRGLEIKIPHELRPTSKRVFSRRLIERLFIGPLSEPL